MAKTRCKLGKLKYPSADNIKNRTSTIARSMASTIANRIPCDDATEKVWLNTLDLDPKHPKCAYCGKEATHLDHLHPLIDGKYPTGWGTEAGNLVPCCSDCNSKKGKMSWKIFMEEKKQKAKDAQEINDIQDRINKIEDMLDVLKPKRNVAVDDPKFKEIWDAIYKKLCNELNAAQTLLENVLNLTMSK